MIAALLIPLIILGLPALYCAWHSRDFRKFLAGAVFVAREFYSISTLPRCRCRCSAPLVLTPEISGFRSIVHFILFALCFYFGFIKTQKIRACDAVMLSEAKHFWSILVGYRPKRDPRCFASLRMTF